MKILFLTTFGVTFFYEHGFTRDVFFEIQKQIGNEPGMELELATIKIAPVDKYKVSSEPSDGTVCHNLLIPTNCDNATMLDGIKDLFRKSAADLVHSQMTEGVDIEAAHDLGLPIVNTIHIGGLICPASGGTGFMLPDGSACNSAISPNCLKCLEKKLPFNFLTRPFRALTTKSVRESIRKKLSDKRIFYISPLLDIDHTLDLYVNRLDLLKYSHLIAANNRLVDLLTANGITENVHLIPHGVKSRLGKIVQPGDGPIKFYYVGRIDKAKGIDLMIKAFRRLNPQQAELHIIGDPGVWAKSRSQTIFWKKISKLGNRKNIFFHGRFPNGEIDSLISNWHVMIHPARYLEIYGIAIAEALSMGHPVIATRCGGAEMQIEDGKNGWLIPQNDELALTTAMQLLIDNPEMITEASKQCSIPHPIDEYTHQLIELYKNLIQK